MKIYDTIWRNSKHQYQVWVGGKELYFGNLPHQRVNESEQYLQMYIKFISISYNTARYKDCLSQHCSTHFHSYLLCLHAPLPKFLGTTQERGYNSNTKRTCNLDRKLKILLKKEMRTNEITGRDSQPLSISSHVPLKESEE